MAAKFKKGQCIVWCPNQPEYRKFAEIIKTQYRGGNIWVSLKWEHHTGEPIMGGMAESYLSESIDSGKIKLIKSEKELLAYRLTV